MPSGQVPEVSLAAPLVVLLVLAVTVPPVESPAALPVAPSA